MQGISRNRAEWIHLVIASLERKIFSASELSTSKAPLIWFKQEFHAGEIDGKMLNDANFVNIALGDKKEVASRKANNPLYQILNVERAWASSEFWSK